MQTKTIALFLPSLKGGGAQRVGINLLHGMLKRNLTLDLVLATAEGPYLSQVPQQVRIVNLGAGRLLKAIMPLASYLRKTRPRVLLSHMGDANVVAVIARKLAHTNTRLILVQHNTLSASQSRLFRARFVQPLIKRLYPRADAIVCVSKAVAQDLENQIGLKKGKVKTIYNPVVDNELISKANIPLEHLWFQEDAPPVFLAVGRLTEQKDFLTLIKAFAILRKQVIARLLILGEGEARAELETTINQLNNSKDIAIPGFIENPYSYMKNATAFVLSSRWEGLPTVLIEAMACGCPVIATDCPSGPMEILAGGRYGPLVTVGDEQALANAMLQVLESPVNRDVLMRRAMDFSYDRAVTKYLTLLGYM